MTLTAGTRLGPYEIVSLLGEGGMGEVYRARDTKLNRDVAIKVLPAAFAEDADRLARFTREAQTLAALNHPNIAHIHGLEESPSTGSGQAGPRGLVMELVEGEDLAQRLTRGPIPLDDALPIARQIAEALEAAHEAGIVHRDLKPANVKVRPDGTVKVLDFGLAKAMFPGAEAPGLQTDGGPGLQARANLPTITSPAQMTQAGIVLGTVAYMAPEQARGKAVDRRADIWAFGVVLYEMLTGRRAFAGDDLSEVLAAVLRDSPALEALPDATPPAVSRVLARCLERDPRQRLRDIGEARVEIERAQQPPGREATPPAPRTPATGPTSARRTMAVWFLAGLAAGAALVGVPWLVGPSPDVTRRPVRATIDLPPDTALALGRGSAVALSPDGRRLAFAGRSKNVSKLYIRPLDQFDTQAIDGTEGATNPFFSPDGQWVAFFAEGKLKKVSLDGGAPVTVTDAGNPRGEAWADAATILLTPSNNTGISRVPAAGGTAAPLTSLATGELSHRWPRALPDGSALLFTVWNDTGWEPSRIVAERSGTRERSVVVAAGGGYGRYVRDGAATHGFLVYARAEGLLAARFDESRLALTSQAVPVVDGVITNLSGGAHFDLSPSGTLAYVPGALGEADRELQWVALDGTATPAARVRSMSRFWTLSPDGTRLARNNTTGPNRDVWIEDLARQTTARLTTAGDNYNAIWSRDGQWVIFARGIPTSNLYRRAADGSGREERLTATAANQAPSSVSPDGATLLFSEFDSLSGSDIWLLTLPPPGSAGQADVAVGREARPFVKTAFSEGNAVFSPDGRWVAYQSNESGRFEVYLRSFPDAAQKIQVSRSGGIWPVWAPSGRELLYRGGGATVMAAAVTTVPAIHVDTPRVLFDGSRYENVFGIAPDGTRLLMMPLVVAEQSATRIHLVLDFIDELRQRVR